MPSAPQSFAAKSPIPVYAVVLPRSDVLLYAGGGGQSRSGVANAIRSVSIDVGRQSISEKTAKKLSNEEDAPMCMAIMPLTLDEERQEEEVQQQAEVVRAKNSSSEDERGKVQSTQRKVIVGINAAVNASGHNENLRLFDWTSSGRRQGERGESGEENKATQAKSSSSDADVHSIDVATQAESIKVTDEEVYIKRTVVSPNGKYLAVGSTDGQMALHAFPSLDRLWSTSASDNADIVDATFSADSALVAFVTPSAVLVYPTVSSSSAASPNLYQSIRNPSLKGSAGCVFRAARFGRNKQGAKNVKSSRLYTVVNTNPPAGLGSSKKDREKAKIRKCFVSVWDADHWTLLQTRQISDRPATVAELSESGEFFAISTSDLTIHLLSAQTLRTIWQIKDAHAFPGTCLAFSPRADVLVSGSADMSLRIATVGEKREPNVVTALLDGRLMTLFIAILFALIAWYMQDILTPSSRHTTSSTLVSPAPSNPLRL